MLRPPEMLSVITYQGQTLTIKKCNHKKNTLFRQKQNTEPFVCFVPAFLSKSVRYLNNADDWASWFIIKSTNNAMAQTE